MADNYVCWKCGAAIGHLPFPLGRMSKCEKCQADLHVCELCKYYDKTRANQCQETVADPVVDKKRANFCGYFQILPDAFKNEDSSTVTAAEQELEALFGGPVNIAGAHNESESKSELENLFSNVDKPNKGKSDKN